MRRLSTAKFIKNTFVKKFSSLVCRANLKYFRVGAKTGGIDVILQRAFNGSDNFIGTFKQRLRERFFISDLNRKEFYINLMTSLVKDPVHKTGFDSIMDDADMVHENRFKVGRFHEAIWLGKAYWVSHNEIHAQKFADMTSDWLDNVPAGFGVNWISPVESAIRAMNLIVGLMYFNGSDAINDKLFMKLVDSLYNHGTHIHHDFKKHSYSTSTNIPSIVGLLYIGVFFCDTEIGKRWLALARRELESELLKQICEDGTCRERSVSGQAFLTELLTAAYILIRVNGFDTSDEFKSRLEKMFKFLINASMPNGKLPNIDVPHDGFVFKMRPGKVLNDRRDLFAIAATIFENGTFKSAAREFSELALMLLGTEGFEKFSSLKEDSEITSAVFPQAGFAFLKTRKDYCSFSFGNIGRQEYNDVLSFELSGKNELIVDRGSYCDPFGIDSETMLRSPYSHNRVVIDSAEQADYNKVHSSTKTVTTELSNWSSTVEQDVIEAQHHGYGRLQDPLIHKRKITFNKQSRTFIIEDNFLGNGRHEIELMFHFAPELRVTEAGRNFLALEGEEFALLKFQLPFVLEDWEHLPQRGVPNYAKSARVKVSAEFPARVETFIFILGSLDEMNYLLNHIS